jgi:hypothetical protein
VRALWTLFEKFQRCQGKIIGFVPMDARRLVRTDFLGAPALQRYNGWKLPSNLIPQEVPMDQDDGRIIHVGRFLPPRNTKEAH